MYEEIDCYVLRLIEQSSPERTAWNIERMRAGKPATWNYIDGCMMTALLAMTEITGDQRCFDFAESFIDSFVNDDGTIRTYKAEGHALDDVNEGRVLFPLFEKTGKEKYKKAADFLWQQLEAQPRTGEGSFWHKQIYPNQVWLDGIYMAQPFAGSMKSISAAGITATSSARSKRCMTGCGMKRRACITMGTISAGKLSGATRKRA